MVLYYYGTSVPQTIKSINQSNLFKRHASLAQQYADLQEGRVSMQKNNTYIEIYTSGKKTYIEID